MKLSILIPTLISRQDKWKELTDGLLNQINAYEYGKDWEIISYSDNKENTLGKKRNWLLERAKGEFTVFIDDDDKVSPNYVKNILDVISREKEIDSIGFRGMYYENGVEKKQFRHSIRHSVYSEDKEYYYRCPNHLNPIRATISKEYKFIEEGPKSMCGEDTEWTMRIQGDCRLLLEHFIDEIMYHYYFDNKNTETQLVEKHTQL